MQLSSPFREMVYEREKKGCFLLFFKHDSKRLCIDATEENGTIGRLINHASKNENLKMKIVIIDQQPRVVFVALRHISVGEELLYNYGDRRTDVVEANPWLRS